MTLSLTADEEAIVASADALLSRDALSHARSSQQQRAAPDADRWRRMADAGWLSAMLPLEKGGVGFDMRRMMLILEKSGEYLAPEPLVLALGSSCILAATENSRALSVLEGQNEGRRLCAPIIQAFGLDAAQPPLEIRHNRLQGVSAFAFDIDKATEFVFVAEDNGLPQLCLIDRASDGLSVEAADALDGGTMCRLHLNHMETFSVIATGETAVNLEARARVAMRLGYASQLTGALSAAFRLTVGYLKLRRQFGVPIGTFQALQHRAAALHVALYSSRALLYEACNAGPGEEQRAAAMVKARISGLVTDVVEEAVQMHGAIGYTEEYDLGLYVRRALCLKAAGGDAATCLRELSQGPLGSHL